VAARIADRHRAQLLISNNTKPGGTKFSLCFESSALGNSLFGEGLPVAKPIATNESFNFAIKEVWAFDDYRAGNHPTRGKVAPLVSKQLGSMLQVMHKLPVSGFGRLEKHWKIIRQLSIDHP